MAGTVGKVASTTSLDVVVNSAATRPYGSSAVVVALPSHHLDPAPHPDPDRRTKNTTTDHGSRVAQNLLLLPIPRKVETGKTSTVPLLRRMAKMKPKHITPKPGTPKEFWSLPFKNIICFLPWHPVMSQTS